MREEISAIFSTGDSNDILRWIEDAAHRMLYGSLDDVWGEITPSVYDTARLVMALPDRYAIEGSTFLLRWQNSDGSWGGPELYRLVPTLAATIALLSLLQSPPRTGASPVPTAQEVNFEKVVSGVKRSLTCLPSLLLCAEASCLPDTVAIELLLPALVEELNGLLSTLAEMQAPQGHLAMLVTWVQKYLHLPLSCPVHADRLIRLRVATQHNRTLPVHISHCLELFHNNLNDVNIRNICPINGIFGASPAATVAMWTRSPDPEGTESYLQNVLGRYGAPPCVVPISTWERAWIGSLFLQAKLPLSSELQSTLISFFHSTLGIRGACGREGLPADSDTSSVILGILMDLECPVDPSLLLHYEGDEWFHCYSVEERTASVSANAHILEAFGKYFHYFPSRAPLFQNGVEKISAYLCAVQHEEGYWLDKWHASPYYGTWCCAVALYCYGVRTLAVDECTRRAVRWILQTQRPDGSWGRWYGTGEETAYALLTLQLINAKGGNNLSYQAIKQGITFLMQFMNASCEDNARMPLWHDKELYEPRRVVDAAVLAALYLFSQRCPYPNLV